MFTLLTVDARRAVKMNIVLCSALVLLSLVVDASAEIFARECRQVAAMNVDHSNAVLDPKDPVCSKHVCGRVPETELKFYERLSPQCGNLMEQYMSKWSRMGVSNFGNATPVHHFQEGVGSSWSCSHIQPTPHRYICDVHGSKDRLYKLQEVAFHGDGSSRPDAH